MCRISLILNVARWYFCGIVQHVLLSPVIPVNMKAMLVITALYCLTEGRRTAGQNPGKLSFLLLCLFPLLNLFFFSLQFSDTIFGKPGPQGRKQTHMLLPICVQSV